MSIYFIMVVDTSAKLTSFAKLKGMQILHKIIIVDSRWKLLFLLGIR